MQNTDPFIELDHIEALDSLMVITTDQLVTVTSQKRISAVSLRAHYLAPCFFVIFINDLPEVVTPGKIVSLYADDCKTSRVINRPADHSDIDNIYRWSLQNRMEFNVNKCKLMRI